MTPISRIAFSLRSKSEKLMGNYRVQGRNSLSSRQKNNCSGFRTSNCYLSIKKITAIFVLLTIIFLHLCMRVNAIHEVGEIYTRTLHSSKRNKLKESFAFFFSCGQFWHFMKHAQIVVHLKFVKNLYLVRQGDLNKYCWIYFNIQKCI